MDRHQPGDQQGVRRFRILVAGRLGRGFAEGIDENIEQHPSEDGTLLTGPLVDQSHIHGILDHLRQLGVEVLSFDTYAAGAPANTDDHQAQGSSDGPQ